MALTEVILRDKIKNLGAEADVVKVRAGFARNYLIPQGKAFEANKENLQEIENLKVARAQREAQELTVAQDLAGKVSRQKLKFTLEVGANSKAFGSVTSIDIQKKLAEKGFDFERPAILLDSPIKTTGKQDVEIRLHPDVHASVTVTVEAKTDENE